MPSLPLPHLLPSAPFKKAAALACACNLLALLYILYSLLTSFYFYPTSLAPPSLPDADRPSLEALARIKEAFEARRAFEPVALIKRVKEIQEESNQHTLKSNGFVASRKKLATELAQKLTKLKGASSRSNQKAVDKWRKKKLGAAKQRELEAENIQDQNETAVLEDRRTGSTNNTNVS